MVDLGYATFPKICRYGNFVDSWYAFVILLDLDWLDGFLCEKCGPDPETIVCDGTSLGFRRELLMSAIGGTVDPEIPIKRRRYEPVTSGID